MDALGKLKRYSLNVLILSLSIILSALILEGCLRIFLNPSDFLASELINDEIVGLKIKPNSAGHDAWGFRNHEIPTQADIVTLGDSWTYGVNTPANDTWPVILERLSGRKVYNMGLGGYSPPVYYYLMENKALLLHPKEIIVGLFMGNDFAESYMMVHQFDYWKKYAKSAGGPRPNTGGTATGWDLQKLAGWLSRHSLSYRILDSILREKIHDWNGYYNRMGLLPVNDLGGQVITYLPPNLGPEANDPRIQEGVQVALEILDQMAQLAKEQKVEFTVMLIPSKASVCVDYIKNNRHTQEAEKLKARIASELEIKATIIQHFEENGISYLDVLDPLRQAMGKSRIFSPDDDDHARKEGYEIMARSLQEYLAARDHSAN